MLDKQDGNRVVVRLLRDIEWVKRERVQVGAVLWLDRHEMGAVGCGVTAVAASPRLPSGPGSRVTATFRHHAGVVLDLSVEGEGKAIGVTPTHLVWSTDRQQWASAGEMRVGERMAASNGSTPCVLSLKQREHPEEVFNIEVDGDHVYRVGEQGLLVHNASTNPGIVPDPKSTADFYVAKDCQDPRFFVTGRIDSYTDCLIFTIVTKIRSTQERSSIPPEDFFDAMMAHFGKSAGGHPACIRGIWNDSDEERKTNLNIFNTLKAAGKSDEDAAKGTFTGRMAVKYNYSKVSFGAFAPPNGPAPYQSVNAYFRK